MSVGDRLCAFVVTVAGMLHAFWQESELVVFEVVSRGVFVGTRLICQGQVSEFSLG